MAAKIGGKKTKQKTEMGQAINEQTIAGKPESLEHKGTKTQNRMMQYEKARLGSS